MTWRETVPGRLQGHEHGQGCEGAFSRGCGLFGLSVVLIIVAGNNSKSGSAMAGASLFLISVLLGVGDCIVALTRWWKRTRPITRIRSDGGGQPMPAQIPGRSAGLGIEVRVEHADLGDLVDR